MANLLRTSLAGQIFPSFSLNMANIRLIRAPNPARPHVRSLRPPWMAEVLVLREQKPVGHHSRIAS